MTAFFERLDAGGLPEIAAFVGVGVLLVLLIALASFVAERARRARELSRYLAWRARQDEEDSTHLSAERHRRSLREEKSRC